MNEFGWFISGYLVGIGVQSLFWYAWRKGIWK